MLDIDIQAFFDSLDHDLVVKAVTANITTEQRWVLLYVKRWLTAPLQHPDGRLQQRDRGTPQGSAVSPVLANLVLHYALDAWMAREFPTVPFERYADDAVIHCATERQARQVWAALDARLTGLGLQLHPDKTRIVYCKDKRRRGCYEHTSFTFLGYTFQPRKAKGRDGGLYLGFLPAVSAAALKKMSTRLRRWRLHLWITRSLDELADAINPIVRGWMHYYGRFYRSALTPVLRHLERALVKWAQRKYKRLRRHSSNAAHWLGQLARRDPNLLVLWQIGIRPATGS